MPESRAGKKCMKEGPEKILNGSQNKNYRHGGLYVCTLDMNNGQFLHTCDVGPPTYIVQLH